MISYFIKVSLFGWMLIPSCPLTSVWLSSMVHAGHLEAEALIRVILNWARYVTLNPTWRLISWQPGWFRVLWPRRMVTTFFLQEHLILAPVSYMSMAKHFKKIPWEAALWDTLMFLHIDKRGWELWKLQKNLGALSVVLLTLWGALHHPTNED